MALSPGVTAWLLAQLGTDTNLADLENRYVRLGSARAVALEVLRQRLADLRAQPAAVTVSSVVAVNYTANLAAYERQIAALEAGDSPAPDDPPGTSGIGLFILRARDRR